MYFRFRGTAVNPSKQRIFVVRGMEEVAEAYLQELWDDQEEYDIVELAAESSNDKRSFPKCYSSMPLLSERSTIIEIFNSGYRFTFEICNGLGRWGFESFDLASHAEKTHHNEFLGRDIISIKSHIFHRFERILSSTDYDPALKRIKGSRTCTVRIYLDYDFEQYQGGNYVEYCVSPDMAVLRFFIALCEGTIPHSYGLTQVLYDGPGGMGKKVTWKDAYNSNFEMKDWDLGFDNMVWLLLSTG